MKLSVIKICFLSLLINGFNLNAQKPTDKLLAIFAHPDDEQTIAPFLVKSVEEGVEVTLVIATDGRPGVNEYSEYEAGDRLAEIRKNEMLCAAEVLGVNLIHLDYHDQLKAGEGFDGHIPHVQNLIFELKDIIEKIQPDAIITWGPDGATTHMDHRLVGASVTQIFVSKKWENGLATFHGMHSRGFPNSFFFGPAQSGFTATYTYSLDEQSIHLAHILKVAKDKGATRIEASQEAEEKWIETIIDKARLTADFQENCTPGYYNNEGKVNQTPQNNTYGGGPIEFFSLMEKWRSKGNLEGLELS